MENTSLNQNKLKKIKLDFKDANMQLVEEKAQLLKYGLKRVTETYMLMVLK